MYQDCLDCFTFPQGQLLGFFGISIHEIPEKKDFSCLLLNFSSDDDVCTYWTLPNIRRVAFYQAFMWRLRFQFGFCPAMGQKS